MTRKKKTLFSFWNCTCSSDKYFLWISKTKLNYYIIIWTPIIQNDSTTIYISAIKSIHNKSYPVEMNDIKHCCDFSKQQKIFQVISRLFPILSRKIDWKYFIHCFQMVTTTIDKNICHFEQFRKWRKTLFQLFIQLFYALLYNIWIIITISAGLEVIYFFPFPDWNWFITFA